MRLAGTSTYGVANCGRLSVATDFFVDGSVNIPDIVIVDPNVTDLRSLTELTTRMRFHTH